MKEVLTPKKNNERRSLRKSARQVKMIKALLLIMSRLKRLKFIVMSKCKGDPEEEDNREAEEGGGQ